MPIIFSILLVLFITAVSALAGRAHGSGWSSVGRVAAKIWLGSLMGLGCYLLYGVWWLALLGVGLSIWAFSTGHGRVYAMYGADLRDPNPEVLERIFGRFWKGPINRPAYSWYIMGLKGGLVSFPIFPIGLLMCFLWPLSYYWSFKNYNSNELAEWASCGFAGFLAATIIAVKLMGA